KYAKLGPLPRQTLHFDAATVGLGQRSHQCEAEAETAGGGRRLVGHPRVLVEYAGELAAGNAHAEVLDRDLDHARTIVRHRRADDDAAAAGRVLDGVRDQILENPIEPVTVSRHSGDARAPLEAMPVMLRGEKVDVSLERLPDVDVFANQL